MLLKKNVVENEFIGRGGAGTMQRSPPRLTRKATTTAKSSGYR
jgi:hypothetical protein